MTRGAEARVWAAILASQLYAGLAALLVGLALVPAMRDSLAATPLAAPLIVALLPALTLLMAPLDLLIGALFAHIGRR
jgi:hypothetical protein